jgi:hypothetical protein
MQKPVHRQPVLLRRSALEAFEQPDMSVWEASSVWGVRQQRTS